MERVQKSLGAALQEVYLLHLLLPGGKRLPWLEAAIGREKAMFGPCAENTDAPTGVGREEVKPCESYDNYTNAKDSEVLL